MTVVESNHFNAWVWAREQANDGVRRRVGLKNFFSILPTCTARPVALVRVKLNVLYITHL